MTLRILNDVEQGSQEWLDARRGILTASTIGRLITPRTIRVANNDTSRAFTLQLIAERITGRTEDVYVSADMERGTLDEPHARATYHRHIAPVTEVAFMTEDQHGFTLGYSPDGLVGDDGLIEIKSRQQKAQLATILNDEVPLENMAQLQAGLLVTGRKWIDYVSYCGGMPLYVKRIHPIPAWHDTIIAAGREFEESAKRITFTYNTRVAARPTTERINHYLETEIA